MINSDQSTTNTYFGYEFIHEYTIFSEGEALQTKAWESLAQKRERCLSHCLHLLSAPSRLQNSSLESLFNLNLTAFGA